jgi:hypothetical protein
LIVTRPERETEADLLAGRERMDLLVTPLCGGERLSIPAPSDGWTHARLETAVERVEPPWDASLGGQWIGSSEV